MERIEIKGKYDNMRLLRESREYTIDTYARKDFNGLNTAATIEIVKAQAVLYVELANMRSIIRQAKELNNIEVLEQIKAGKLTAVVSFDTRRLDPVEIVAVIV